MKTVFTANDLEAADLLALARLDVGGAPPAVTPPRASGGQAVTRYAWPAPSR